MIKMNAEKCHIFNKLNCFQFKLCIKGKQQNKDKKKPSWKFQAFSYVPQLAVVIIFYAGIFPWNLI